MYMLGQLLLQATQSKHPSVVPPPFKGPVKAEGQSVGSCHSLVFHSMTTLVASVKLPLVLLGTADLPDGAVDEAPTSQWHT